MASQANIDTLGAEIQALSDRLAELSESPNRAVSSICSQLLFLLSLAVRDIAFGPSEWASVTDADVISATETVAAANATASEVESGKQAMELAKAVTEAIARMKKLA